MTTPPLAAPAITLERIGTRVDWGLEIGAADVLQLNELLQHESPHVQAEAGRLLASAVVDPKAILTLTYRAPVAGLWHATEVVGARTDAELSEVFKVKASLDGDDLAVVAVGPVLRRADQPPSRYHRSVRVDVSEVQPEWLAAIIADAAARLGVGAHAHGGVR